MSENLNPDARAFAKALIASIFYPQSSSSIFYFRSSMLYLHLQIKTTLYFRIFFVN